MQHLQPNQQNKKFSECSEFLEFPDVQTLLSNIKPEQYAKNRNHIQGDNTQLAPFITHGIIHIAEVIEKIQQTKQTQQNSTINLEHKLVQQFAWRGFFQHVWEHLGNYILTSLDKPIRQFPQLKPNQPMAYLWKNQISEDILTAKTGIPLIDESILDLYETGYLHNHQRMWLMSYLLHWRKVDWNVAANWLYGYLLDGDLASNHLSTQWIGGSFSKKPYIFNAESAAKFTPKKYHSFKTVLDISYEQAFEQAFSTKTMVAKMNNNHNSKTKQLMDIPELLVTPHEAIKHLQPLKLMNVNEFELLNNKNNQNNQDAETSFYGIHPWNLHEKTLNNFQSKNTSNTKIIALLDASFHAKYPWSLKRWLFVLTEMQKYSENEIILWLENPQDWKKLSEIIQLKTTQNNHYANLKLLPKNNVLKTNDTDVYSWQQPTQFFPSFSQYYKNICLINDVKPVDFSHRA